MLVNKSQEVKCCDECFLYEPDKDMSATIPGCIELDSYLKFKKNKSEYNSIALNCPFLKDTFIVESIESIRDLVEEYFYLRCNEDILMDDDVDVEKGQKELNQFLRWLGVKKPIADKLGWENVRKICIGKRRETPEEVKRKVKEYMKKGNNLNKGEK